jgi:hypothetical protein
MRGPLLDYIHTTFTAAFRVEGFAFLVRTGREISPINIVQFEPSTSRIDFSTVGNGGRIARIDVRDLSAADSTVTRLVGADATMTPINSGGHRAGPSAATEWPLHVTGLARVSVEIASTALPSNRAGTALYLRDHNGHAVATLRFDE